MIKGEALLQAMPYSLRNRKKHTQGAVSTHGASNRDA
ncbi:MAG: hypothetical protein K0S39_831 [Paenibacillus sp.]|jgi:hypothetical protein|nr:hypothetical protein [Paenibacillus sp.]